MDAQDGCPSEERLVEHVEGLLAPHATREVEAHVDRCRNCARLLAAYGEAAFGSEPRDQASLLPGDRVGRYLVIDFLGQGGMGVVYAAYDPQLDRKIALKLLRLDVMEPPAREARQALLLREAQALARLNHPNTTAVYDAGRDGQRLFLAMEFVEGGDLAGWLGKSSRSTDEILTAFLAAGRGLAAAHAAGLVHRDFKPANVLVDGGGRIKVSDFGLARLLERGITPDVQVAALSPSSDAPMVTLSGTVVGTPGYLAPEQLRGEPVDARADQFAFCAALFEALFGTRPFAGDTVEALAACYRTGSTPQVPRDSRVPPWLRSGLLRGLALSPADRYASMEDLLEAIAQDPRAQRRRQLAVGAALLAVVGAAWLGARALPTKVTCEQASQEVSESWNPSLAQRLEQAFADTRLPYADRTARSVVARMDEQAASLASMQVAACTATRVRGTQSEMVLDLRTACFRRVRRELHTTAALFSGADASLVSRALDVVERLTPVAHCADVEALRTPERPSPLVAREVDAIEAALVSPEIELHAGHVKQAAPRLAELARRADLLHYRPLEARIAVLQAEQLGQNSEHPEARAKAEKAVYAAISGRDDRTLFDAGRALVVQVLATNSTAAAEPWLRITRAVAERLASDPTVSAQLAYLEAQVADRSGDPRKAYTLHQKALTEMETARGKSDPSLLHLLAGVAVQALELGRRDEALAYAKRGVQLGNATLGEGHFQVARLNLALGYALAATKDSTGALAALADAQPALEREYGPEHEEMASLWEARADAYDEQGKVDEALSAYQKSIAIRRKLLGPKHESVAAGLYNLGTTLNKRERWSEALPCLEEAEKIYIGARSKGHVSVGICAFERGRALRGLGRNAEGLAALELAQPLIEKQMDDASVVAELRDLLAKARHDANAKTR